MPALDNKFWTKEIAIGNGVDLVFGSLDTAHYPDAGHPYTADPVFLPVDNGGTSNPERSFVTSVAQYPIVLENAPAGTFVVVVGGVSRLPVQYALTDDADGRFNIDSQTGLITVEDGSKIDYESSVAHEVEVTTTFLSGGTAPIVDTLTIFVRDVNEAPTAIALDNATVEENAAGAMVGVVIAEDEDIGDTHTYQSSDLRFEVVGDQLKLKDGVDLDHESEPSVTLAITATDEGGLSFEQSFTISVEDVNEAPIAVNDEGGTTENAAVNIDVLANDTDVDDGDDSGIFSLDSVSIASVTGLIGAGTGIVSIDGNQLRFDPGSDFDELDEGDTATVVVDYTMSDDDGASSAGQATITVTGVNDAPVVTDVTAAAVENGQAVSGSFLGDDVDADDDGSTLTYSLTSLPSEGVVADIDNQIFTFDPEDDFQDLGDGETRDVTFGYTATDSQGAVSNIATVTITVTGVNDAPTLDVNTGKTVAEGSVELLSVTELSASDPDNTDAEIVYTVTTAPAHGHLALSDNQGEAITEFTQEDLAAARVVYIHDGGEAASDSFIFDVDDPDGAGPGSQLFTIAVTPVNDAPTLDVNALTIEEGETKLIGPETLRANDSDTDPEDLTFTIGDLVAGRFERVADPGVAIDQFTQAELDSALIQFVHDGGEQPPAYTVTLSDGQETVGPFVADVSFEGVNDPPVVEDVAVSGSEDGAAVSASFVGDDVDSDDNGTTLTYAITSSPAEGGVADNGDGTFTFDPGAGFQDLAEGETRDVTFDYTATDSHGAVSNTGMVTVTVTGVNDAPVVEGVAASATEDGLAVTASFVGDDVDFDDNGTPLTYAITSSPVEGSVADNGDGTFTFDPGAGFQDLAEGETRDVTFDYTATDAHGAMSNTGTVTVNVTGVNDAPVVEDVAASAVEDGPAVIVSFPGNDADSDDDGTTLTYAISSAPSEGGVVTNGDGTFTFDPGMDFQDLAEGGTRDVTFDYAATDSHGAVSNTGVVTVTVTGVNDAPMDLSLSNNRVGENASNGTIVGTIWATDPDTEDGFVYELTDDAGGAFVVDPITGRLTVDNPIMLDFENPEFEGIYSIEVSVTDPGDETYTERMDIVLTDFNEAPTGIDPSGGEVLPNPANGTVVAELTTIDPDTTGWSPIAETFTYALLDNARGRFSLDGDEIVVADGARIEQGNDYELLVRSTDKGGLSVDQVLIISANAPPPALAAFSALGEFSQFEGDGTDTFPEQFREMCGGRGADPDGDDWVLADGLTSDDPSVDTFLI